MNKRKKKVKTKKQDNLVQAFEPVSTVSCKSQATFINYICPKPGKNKESKNEIQIHIVLPWPRLTKPWSKIVDLKPSPDKGSHKLNMLKQRRNTQQIKLYCTTWTHIWIPALKDGDFERSAKGGIIGPECWGAMMDHPEVCILNNLPSISHTKEPK